MNLQKNNGVVLISVALIVISGFILWQKKNRSKSIAKTKIGIEKTFHNFGIVKTNQVLSHTFKIINKGDIDLVIKDAAASCGCTIPSYSKTPIKPNDTAELVVQYHTRGKLGKQREIVQFLANTPPQESELEILAKVEQ